MRQAGCQQSVLFFSFRKGFLDHRKLRAKAFQKPKLSCLEACVLLRVKKRREEKKKDKRRARWCSSIEFSLGLLDDHQGFNTVSSKTRQKLPKAHRRTCTTTFMCTRCVVGTFERRVYNRRDASLNRAAACDHKLRESSIVDTIFHRSLRAKQCTASLSRVRFQLILRVSLQI